MVVNNILFYFSFMLVLHSLITQERKDLMLLHEQYGNTSQRRHLSWTLKKVLDYVRSCCYMPCLWRAYHCVPNSTATSPTQVICVPTVCFKIGKPGIYFTWKQFFTWSATHIVPTTTHCTGTIKFLKIVGSHAGVVTQITELDCSKFP